MTKVLNVEFSKFRLLLAASFPTEESNIIKASSTHEILETISTITMWKCFMNTATRELCKIIGVGQDLTRETNNFQSEMTSFSATIKIIDFIKSTKGTIQGKTHISKTEVDKSSTDVVLKYCQSLLIKLQSAVAEKNLDCIPTLWDSITEILSLESSPAIPTNISSACDEVTWLISERTAKQLLAKAESYNTLARQLELTRIMLDGKILYQQVRIHQYQYFSNFPVTNHYRSRKLKCMKSSKKVRIAILWK